MQSLANVELDRDNFRRRWEAEQQAHSDTVDLYNTDKRNISNISQANEMESRGRLDSVTVSVSSTVHGEVTCVKYCSQLRCVAHIHVPCTVQPTSIYCVD